MYQFVETIKLIDGCACNIGYHNDRLNKTRHHFWQTETDIDLNNYVNFQENNATIKARVVYGENGIQNISYSKYTIRIIKKLKIITDNNINYSFKSTDRSEINKLVEKKDECDEIIISKNELLTDSSFTNIALSDGKIWYTPKAPLLHGTKRSCLIDEKRIIEKDINKNDIFKYKAIRLFNAMIDFGDIHIPINNETILL